MSACESGVKKYITESVLTATRFFQVLRLGEAVPNKRVTYEYQIRGRCDG